MLRHSFAGLLLVVLPFLGTCVSTWQNALETKSAQIEVSWFTSEPFIFRSPDGNMSGVEVEIMASFKDYLLEKHNVKLSINWKEASSFAGIMENVKTATSPNLIGISAFSITEKRKTFLQFTNAYLPDISVLVSSKEVPIFDSYKALLETLDGMTAVTIEATNYERLLLEFRKVTETNFETIYIPSDRNVLATIDESADRFGFIDLPIYLMFIKKGGSLTRQNFFTERGTGYGLIMPLESDWSVPLNAFFTDSDYSEKIAGIISKYIGAELYGFIENLYNQDQLGTSILTKEKEIQLELIRNANLQLASEKEIRSFLVIGIAIAAFLLIIIGILFYNNNKATKLLLRQKIRIEFQQQDIGSKNEQLINRNSKLIALNEEKNNMVRILAHDLRSPLNQIIGLTKALPTQAEVKGVDSNLVEMIVAGAQQINEMIAKILDMDVLEGKQGLVLKETVTARDILKAIENRFSQQAAQKNISLKCVNVDRGLQVETDHMLLLLILQNLVSNAVKFSKAGSEVTVGAKLQDNLLIFSIADQGPGFTEEDKSLAFKRFQKLSAKPTGNETSTGLGLSIVKKYVRDLGGKVWLESEFGRGSTFYVSLPA